jgi:hypothetical protein
MKVQFTISEMKETNEGKTLRFKLVQKVTMIGIVDAKKITYYLGGINIAAKDTVKLGTVVEEDLDNYWIVERPVAAIKAADGNMTFMSIDEAKKAGAVYEEMKLKWLHHKAMHPEKPVV